MTPYFFSLIIGIFERNNLSMVLPSPIAPVINELGSNTELVTEIMEKVKKRLPGPQCSEGCCDHGEEHSHEHEITGDEHVHKNGCCENDCEVGEHKEEEEAEDEEEFDIIDAFIAEGNIYICHINLCIYRYKFAYYFKSGTGLYRIQALMNHSCKPNARAYKDANSRNGAAEVIAIRDIMPGEEIEISYLDAGVEGEELDVSEDLEWRRESLREYGIDACTCSKCSVN